MTEIKRCEMCRFKSVQVAPYESPFRPGEIVQACWTCRERDHEGYAQRHAEYAEWTRDAQEASMGGLWE